MTYFDIVQSYNLMNNNNLNDITSIFDGIDIDSRVDKEILATTILDECGAMRCIYTTSVTFKVFSDNFFKKYKDAITKTLDALDIKYNPIQTIDFNWTETTDISQNLDTGEDTTENRTKTNTGSETTTGSNTESTSSNNSTETNNTGTRTDSGNSTEENTVSAMNESTYQPDSHKTLATSNTRTDDLTETEETDFTESKTAESTEETVDDKHETINATNNRTKNEQLTWGETDTHTEKGSKGFAYQDLIQKELKIRNFSIYSWIAKKYASELFLLIY